MFKGDVAFCAGVIFCDLAALLTDLGLSSMRELCVYYSCRLLPDPALPAWVGAMWDGEQILLSMRVDNALYPEAISHELVHALSDGLRWEPLNCQFPGINYDRSTFIEAVATEVGRKFHTFQQSQLNRI